MGDLMNSNFVKMQERVMGRLGLTSLDEKSIVARVREIFKMADADRSGSIEKGELRATFKKFGLIVTEPELDAMMTKVRQVQSGGEREGERESKGVKGVQRERWDGGEWMDGILCADG
jgi:hypothetical protein